MELLKSVAISCPYCGDGMHIDVDCSIGYQEYIEDCQVCCSPMTLVISVDDKYAPSVVVRHENE